MLLLIEVEDFIFLTKNIKIKNINNYEIGIFKLLSQHIKIPSIFKYSNLYYL